ncbi:hypothetical protein AAHA92_26337 [Salvia divinorum]|uniref:Uncharacterized protein n=1 Tax=Salvia divinorum TaxID=28513 RepID=A0ABD1GEP4_SALDI
MKSITKLGLGLCIIFGSLLLALAAELYYLLWRKKKMNHAATHQETQTPQKRSNFSHILELCRGPTSSSSVHEPQSKDLWLRKPFAEESMGSFPRFLFTIAEETREDLESENGGFNLSDLLQILETPFLTPAASPPYFTPPLTPSLCGEWEGDAEFNRRRASPPPVFRFLREAEEKRRRREEGGDGEFIELVIDERVDNGDCFSSSR